MAGCAVLDPFPALERESPGGPNGDSGASAGEVDGSASSGDGSDALDGGASSDASADGPLTGKLAFAVSARSSESTSMSGGGQMVCFAPNGDAVLMIVGVNDWTVGATTLPAPPDAGKLDFGMVRVDAQGAVKIARRYDLGLMENAGLCAVDANGDVWFAGYRYQQIDETSPIDPLVGKIDVAGDHVFTAPLAANATATASWFLSRALRIAKNGDLVYLANFRGTIEWTNLDGSAGTASSSSPPGIPVNTDDVFVARLDATTGRVIWWKTISSPENEYAYDVAVDAAGDVYLAAQFDGPSLPFPAVTRVGTRTNAVVAKLSGADGSQIWAHAWGDAVDPPIAGPAESALAATKNTMSARAIDVDESGHVVVGGNFRGSVDFGGGVTTSGAKPGFYVAVLDAQTGVAKWMREGRGTTGNGGYVQGVGFDRQGWLVATASSKSTSTGGTGTFAGQSFLTAGLASVVAAKLAVADGSVAWTKTIVASTGSASAYGVAVAPSGRSVAGIIGHGTADLGDGKPVSSTSFAALVGWDP